MPDLFDVAGVVGLLLGAVLVAVGRRRLHTHRSTDRPGGRA